MPLGHALEFSQWPPLGGPVTGWDSQPESEFTMASKQTTVRPSDTLHLVTTAARLGRQFTDARNGLIAYHLAHGVTQADLVKSTGVDKGDVSRIAGMLKALTPQQLGKVKALPIPALAVEGVEARSGNFDRVVKAGEAFRRVRKPRATAPVKSTAEGAEGAESTADDTQTVVNVQSAADIIAALAVLRDAARTVKWAGAEADAAYDLTAEIVDIVMPHSARY